LIGAGLMAPRRQTGLGWDVAGVVAGLGDGVTRFRPGAPVIGLKDLIDVPLGTFAEYVALDADAVAAAPDRLAPVQAATLPLNALTADQALDLLGLEPGRTLLVTGAAGALGGYAVELAVRRGLRVVALAAKRDEATVREFGAQWFVPRSPEPAAAVRALVPGGVDAAIDAAVVGNRARDAVRGGGAFVSVVAGAAPAPLRGTRVHNVWIRADGHRLAELGALAGAGQLSVRVADTYPLDKAAVAFDRLGRGGLRGRLVLVP
jgi:NADPH:quinone reductase